MTAISSTEVSVTWNFTDISAVRHFRVEYKILGIHGSDWEGITVQPNGTKTYLKDLKPESSYLVRVGKSRV